MAATRFACLTLLASLVLAASPASAREPKADRFGGRDLLVYVPDSAPPPSGRALVVVLHGGLGNAERIVGGEGGESGLNLDKLADKDGFVVAYLNGTPVTLRLGDQFLGWNAGGGCCGQSVSSDDERYISGAVAYLEQKYGVDPARVFGIGHSNGAMMAQRMVCDTHVFAATVAVSGPLNLPVTACPDARGQRVLAIHGAADQNVPIAGGRGSEGYAQVAWSSEARSEQVMTASGASYTLDVVPGAPHRLDDIDAAMRRTKGVSLGETALRFFGLEK
jgi:polyhydroxybutyrate depolymerase